MSELHGRRVVLGVTGGVAAYKAAELARLLVKVGVEVDVVLTDAGAQFVAVGVDTTLLVRAATELATHFKPSQGAAPAQRPTDSPY